MRTIEREREEGMRTLLYPGLLRLVDHKLLEVMLLVVREFGEIKVAAAGQGVHCRASFDHNLSG